MGAAALSAAIRAKSSGSPSSFAPLPLQAGLIPRVLSRVVMDLAADATEALRRVPANELTPWWWARDRSKPLSSILFGLGAFRRCPDVIDVLQLPVLMAIVNEYDVQGVALPRSRKAYEANLEPE